MAYENNPSRITQRGFTERLKENLPEGWRYERKRKYVGDWWNDSDIEVLNTYDRKNVYPYEPKPRQAYQALIYKKYWLVSQYFRKIVSMSSPWESKKTDYYWHTD